VACKTANNFPDLFGDFHKFRKAHINDFSIFANEIVLVYYYLYQSQKIPRKRWLGSGLTWHMQKLFS
jgi:hypothetical protein